MKTLLPFACCLAATLAVFSGWSRAAEIPATDERFQFGGVLRTVSVDGGLEFQRFSDETLAQKVPKSFFNAVKARTTSGCAIRFLTDSANVRLRFLPVSAVRQYQFAVYQDGRLAKETQEDPAAKEFVLDVPSVSPGKDVLYEVVLPSWANPAFAGVTLDEGATLKAPPPDTRPLYAAVGDSISHGTGQQSRSDWTFPWLLAREGNWRLINFGIGGSTTSPALVPDIVSVKPDIVTVLWGYNDWQNKQFTPRQYTERYREVLEKLREGVPHAAIFCLTPLATKTESAPNEKKIEDYRAAVAGLVEERRKAGDARIFLVRGEELTTTDDLVDAVHLTPQGAKRFAAALHGAMRPHLLAPQ